MVQSEKKKKKKMEKVRRVAEKKKRKGVWRIAGKNSFAKIHTTPPLDDKLSAPKVTLC